MPGRWIICLLLTVVCVVHAGPLKKSKKGRYSQEELKSFYERGERVYRVDHEASIFLFMRAARGGYAKAMTRLGYCYETGAGVPASRREAIEWYERAIQAGDLSPLCNLAMLHETGDPKRRIPPDYEKAIKLYEQAVKQHSFKACFQLAKIYASCDDPQYHNGEKAVKYAAVLVNRDPNNEENHALMAAAYVRNLEFDKAVKEASLALQMSSLDTVEMRRKQLADCKIGRPFPPVATDAWIFRAADAGSQWAMETLADRHFDKESEMYDLVKARLWYRRSAEKGSAKSLFRLGMLCAQGLGGPLDYQTAFQCFKKAAELGIEESYAWLGRMYLGGKGTDLNYKLAREWLTKAAAVHDNTMSSVQIHLLKQLEDNLEHESGERLYEMGKQWMNTAGRPGSGSSRMLRVFMYYWLAAEKGHTGAMREMVKMYFLGGAYFATKDNPSVKNAPLRINYPQALYWCEELARRGIVLPELKECRKLVAAGIRTKKKPKPKGK